MIAKLQLLTRKSFNMSQYAALAKWFIIAALVSAVGYFGYSHVSTYLDLQKTVETQESTIKTKEGTIKTLSSENDTKDQTITVLESSKKVAEEAASKALKEKQDQEELFNSINKKRQTAEGNARNNKVTYLKQQKGSTSEPVVDNRNLITKLSDIRISSIYDTYCASSVVKDAQNCSATLSNLKG